MTYFSFPCLIRYWCVKSERVAGERKAAERETERLGENERKPKVSPLRSCFHETKQQDMLVEGELVK